MQPFDIFISYISWGSGGKKRPVLVYALNKEFVRIFPITTQYKEKSDVIKAKYFKINDWEKAGLHELSYIDTGTRLTQSLSLFNSVNPIGNLTEGDKQRLIEFLAGSV